MNKNAATSSALTAQRTDVDLKWQESHVIVSFNPVKSGERSGNGL